VPPFSVSSNPIASLEPIDQQASQEEKVMNEDSDDYVSICEIKPTPVSTVSQLAFTTMPSTDVQMSCFTGTQLRQRTIWKETETLALFEALAA